MNPEPGSMFMLGTLQHSRDTAIEVTVVSAQLVLDGGRRVALPCLPGFSLALSSISFSIW